MTLVRLYSRVVGLFGPEARLAGVLALASAALAAAQFAVPVLLGRIVDSLIDGRSTGSYPPNLGLLAGLFTGAALFIVIFGALLALSADRLAHRRRYGALIGFFEHILQLPLNEVDRRNAQRLGRVMISATDSMWAFWHALLREEVSAIVLVAIGIPLALAFNWQLALVLAAIAIVCGAFTVLAVRRARPRQTATAPYYTDLAARTADTLDNVAVVQSFARVETEITGLKDATGRLLSAQNPVLSWWAALGTLTRAASVIAAAVVLLAGLALHLRGGASIGTLVAFTGLAGLIVGRMVRAIAFLDRAAAEMPVLRAFFDVLDRSPVRDRPDAADPGRIRGLVEFKDVSFSYDGMRPAVAEVSFTALPGETIALVGRPGSGKSTVAALLHRAFDPQSGVIMLDGMDVRGLSLAGLRRTIGVAAQEPLMFDRSIAENLRIGKPEANDAELREVLTRVHGLNMIERNLDGLDTRVDDTSDLNASERQRLSLARVLLKNAPLLILDDATAKLDGETDEAVQAAVTEAMKGRTTFIIARRLSTVRNATRILVFEGGRIVETGTFDELLKRGGHFAELARSQLGDPDKRPPSPRTVSNAGPAVSPQSFRDAAE